MYLLYIRAVVPLTVLSGLRGVILSAELINNAINIFANLRTLSKSFFVNKLSKLIRIKPLKLGMPNVIC